MDSDKSSDSRSAKIEESPPEKILASGIQLRASARVSKKLRLDQEQALAQAPSPEKKTESIASNGLVPEEKRRRRTPVIWSTEDKLVFFEALNEHGKNFDAIEKHMVNRAKKRGDVSAKNKEKARYFYYRTWHKLSRYVQFPENVKKVTQELYALINFGELRKKVCHITERNAQKLNELIYSGRTQVRVRGKTWRIRTPVCQALRRLNNLDEDCEEVRLPTRIEVLISPRTNKDSISARLAGHNPKTRALLSLDTSLSTIIAFLKSRWSLQAQMGELKIGPKINATITQPQFKCGQAVTSGSVSLLSHEQRSGRDPGQVQALLDQLHAGKAKGTVKKDKEVVIVTEDVANTEFIDPLIPEQPNISVEQASPEQQKEDVDKDEFAARAREGWTQDSSKKTKIGQLYLMLGSKGILELEYWWPPEDSPKELTKAMNRLVSLAKLYHFKAKVECPCGHKCKTVVKPGGNDTGKMLKRPPATNNKKHLSITEYSLSNNQRNDGGKLEDAGYIPEINQLVPATFKHPLLPAPIKQQNSASTIDTFKQLQAFRPKYCNRRGRSKSRGVVVQRMLPLLPKSSPKNQPLMVAVITKPPPSPTVPIQVGELKDDKTKENEMTASTSIGVPIPTNVVMLDSGSYLLRENEAQTVVIPPTVDSPIDDQFSTNTFKGILGGGGEAELDNTPPTSPSQILKEGGQWLNSEVTDFSLSSFLGHLESPLKANGTSTNDDIPIATDVESHFQSLMAESSLDYTAKFADLAEKIAGNAGGSHKST